MKYPQTFTLFQNLPPELRLHIWKLALPEFSQPGLFPYERKGCWQPKWLTPDDWDYEPGPWDNIRFEFRLDLLTTEIALPTFFADSEARSVTLSWIRDNGLQIRFSKGRLRFTRCFDRDLDAMYIATDKLFDFDTEPIDRRFEPDLLERSITDCNHIKCLAMSEDFFRSEEGFPDAYASFGPRVLYVIVGAQPGMQGQWEVESRDGARSIIWNIESQKFELGDGTNICDDGLYELILEDSKGIGEALVFHSLAHLPLEIRPVFAARKRVEMG